MTTITKSITALNDKSLLFSQTLKGKHEIRPEIIWLRFLFLFNVIWNRDPNDLTLVPNLFATTHAASRFSLSLLIVQRSNLGQVPTTSAKVANPCPLHVSQYRRG